MLCCRRRCSLKSTTKLYSYFYVSQSHVCRMLCNSLTLARAKIQFNHLCVSLLLLLSKWFVFIHRSYVTFLLSFHTITHTHTAHMAAVCSQTTQPNVLLLQTKVGAAVVAFFRSYFCECGCVTICVNIETALWRCYDLMIPYVESVATCYLHQ